MCIMYFRHHKYNKNQQFSLLYVWKLKRELANDCDNATHIAMHNSVTAVYNVCLLEEKGENSDAVSDCESFSEW